MVSLVVFAITQIGCSKGNKLSPDDTALIKGTDRGSFVGNGQGSGLDFDGDDISPLGESISGLDGTDGLLPQDPFLNDSDALANADRPFEPIFFGFDQYSIGTEERTKIQDIANFQYKPCIQNPRRGILRLERNACIQQITGRSTSQ